MITMASDSYTPGSAHSEYFLLTDNRGEPNETVDILSPLPYNDDNDPSHSPRSERASVCLDEEQQEEEITMPSQRDDDDEEQLSSRRLSFSTTRQRRRREHAELNGLNYLNVVTYAAHLFVSWGIGVWGLDGILETRWEISSKYETLVMPARWAYYLWAPILVLEGVFVLAQLFPYYRARPIVQAGTGYFFFYTSLLNTVWTLCFSFRLFFLSFASVVGVLVSLLFLLASQQASIQRGRTRFVEYCLFRFPFYLHTGWMVLMAVDHMTLLFRRFSDDVGLHLASDMVALAVMLPVATFFLSDQPLNDYVVPVVIVWSYCGIASRLEHPSDAMVELYDAVPIEAIRMASWTLALITAACVVPKAVIWSCRQFCTIRLVELDA